MAVSRRPNGSAVSASGVRADARFVRAARVILSADVCLCSGALGGSWLVTSGARGFWIRRLRCVCEEGEANGDWGELGNKVIASSTERG